MGRVGFIGLGNIGSLIANHLIDWPDGLVVCDLSETATAPFAEAGATVATSVAEVGRSCDVISVMVLDDDQVRTVVAELLTTASAGTVIGVHSTIRPETAEELEVTAAEHGVSLLDAPVSGGPTGAAEGRMAVLVGGDREAYERAREPFGRWAEVVVHFGAAGAGTRAKLARNVIHYVAFTAVAESQRLAEAAGVDLRKLGRVVRYTDGLSGGPGAIMLRDSAGPMDPDDGLYEIFDHVRRLGEKDLDLALSVADQLGVDMPLTALARQNLSEGLGVTRAD